MLDNHEEADSHSASGSDVSHKYDFFISYTSADRGWAEWIAWHLETEKYTTKIQDWDFRPGSSFVQHMQDGAANSERTIAVLSPHYLSARFTHPEWQAAFAQDPTGGKGLLVPVRVEKCKLEGVLLPLVYIDLVGKDPDQALSVLISGVNRDRAKPSSEPQFPGMKSSADAGPRFPGTLPPIWNIEHVRNRQFIGRGDELEELRNSLESGHPSAVTQAVHGLGGVGKTQLAIEYAYRYQGNYEIVWWIPSEDPTTMLGAFASLAEQLSDLDAGDGTNEKQVAFAVRRWLESNRNWLVIFDNALNPETIDQYLPRSSSGHILITSRHRDWDAVANTVSIKVWPRADSITYLRERTGETNDDLSDELASKLGDLPLALAQAAGYICSVRGSTINEYIELFQTQKAELWQHEKPPSQYEATVSTTWQVTLDQLSNQSREFIQLLSFFAPDDISWKMFEDGQDQLSQELKELVSNRIARNEAVRELTNFSLMDVTTDVMSVHRMLQSVVRMQLPPEESSRVAAMAVGVVDSAFPYKENEPATWELSGRILHHVVPTVTYAAESASAVCGFVLNQAGLYLTTLGRYSNARSLLQKAIEINEKNYEPDHPTLATSYSNLALVEKNLGNLNDARSLLQKAIEIQEKNYEPDHPTLATSYSNLALVEKNLGNLNDARSLLQKAIEIEEKNYEPDHPTLATSYSNLALVEQDLGNLNDARSLLQKAIEINEKNYEPDHPTLATSYSNLAMVEKNLGNLNDARSLLQKAIEIDEKNYEPDHPTLATSYSNLALVEQDLGNLNDARSLLQKAIEIEEKNYEPDHPTLATSYSNLAMVEQDLGNLNDARSLLQKAIEIDEKNYEPDHPTLATSYSNLALVEQDLGNLNDARSLLQKAHRIATTRLGPDHPTTKTILANLDNVG